jgi:dTDP-L-rhamnose 4-epimerase
MVQPGKRVLVTGAAGFVGSHTTDLLVEGGYEVLAVDNMDPQVHAPADSLPKYLTGHIDAGNIRYFQGDVRDPSLMASLIAEVDAIIHLAATVGVGQSMYQVHRYADVNVGGTATLLDLLANTPHRVSKFVIASSMSIYGEGAYECPECGPMLVVERGEEQVQARNWEHQCPRCGSVVSPITTPESKPLDCTSIYALTKKAQEEMLLVFGRAYRLPVVALRYFNIYGPRQSLSNPYTGVASIFLARLMKGQPPLIFEDGLQSRDFIHVRDIARANCLALEAPYIDQRVYNVGTGKPTTVLDVARTLNELLGTGIEPVIANRFRAGDIRHCYSDPARIAKDLGFEATISPEVGYADLLEWSQAEKPDDAFDWSLKELEEHSLVV